MDRRTFLKNFGIGLGVITITPVIFANKKEKPVVNDTERSIVQSNSLIDQIEQHGNNREYTILTGEIDDMIKELIQKR